MGARSKALKYESIRQEMMDKEDQASFLVSRETLQALLYAEEDFRRLQTEYEALKNRRLKLNVNLMKDLKQQVIDNKRAAREGENKRKRNLYSKLYMANKRVEELEAFLEVNGQATSLMNSVHIDVLKERIRQNEKWGHQRHAQQIWITIALEEFGEVAQAVQRSIDPSWGKDTDAPADNLYIEWIQTAAVALAAAEQVREETHHGETHTQRTIGHIRSDQ